MINIEKTEKIASLYIGSMILSSDPCCPMWNRENFLFSKPMKWNYIDGCLIRAVLMLHELSGDSTLLEYAKRFADAYVNDSGRIPTMDPLSFNLDNINGGRNLLYLYRQTGEEKYLSAAKWICDSQIRLQPRLSCGNFYHKAIYPSQVWLDGTYMALPFMTECAISCGRADVFSDIIRQLRNINSIMKCPETGLYRHGYDETRSMIWADPETGLSREFWLRAMGWYCAALADICEITYKNVPELYELCSSTLNDLLCSLSRYITPEGMLCQLPAKAELEGNYPETSGTLLFSYSALKAYRLGICSEKIKADGFRTLSAVTENYISIADNNIPVLRNICLMAGLGGAQNRDGSEKYYLSEPVVENDAKGIAPFLMAFAELKRLTAQ